MVYPRLQIPRLSLNLSGGAYFPTPVSDTSSGPSALIGVQGAPHPNYIIGGGIQTNFNNQVGLSIYGAYNFRLGDYDRVPQNEYFSFQIGPTISLVYADEFILYPRSSRAIGNYNGVFPAAGIRASLLTYITPQIGFSLDFIFNIQFPQTNNITRLMPSSDLPDYVVQGLFNQYSEGPSGSILLGIHWGIIPRPVQSIEEIERHNSLFTRRRRVIQGVSLEERLRLLNIPVNGRFDARHTALILQNREIIDRLSHERSPVFNETRPIAVVVEATADYNGAFQSQTAKPINVLAEDLRFFTLYYQASNTTELRNILTNLRQVTGRGIHTLIIAGHGNRRSLQLGPDVNQDIQSLDSRDVARGDEDYFRSVMDLNEGELVLHSCSNGGVRDPGDRDPTHGLASEIYDRIDGINVLSMGRPGNIQTFRIRNNLTVDIQWSNGQPSFMYRHHLPPGLLNTNSVTQQVSTGQTP